MHNVTGDRKRKLTQEEDEKHQDLFVFPPEIKKEGNISASLPSPPTSDASLPLDSYKWDRKEWIQFASVCLENLAKRENENFLLTEREAFQEDLISDGEMFCYFYKGNFLPSGKQDGYFWKPSRDTELQHGQLIRRYFYAKSKTGKNIQRQVTWLRNRPDIVLVEYRYKIVGTIRLRSIRSPLEHTWIWIYLVDFVTGIINRFDIRRDIDPFNSTF